MVTPSALARQQPCHQARRCPGTKRFGSPGVVTFFELLCVHSQLPSQFLSTGIFNAGTCHS